MFKADGQIKCLLEWICDSYKLGMNPLHEHNFFENSPTKVVMSYSNFTPRKNAYFTFATEDQRLLNFGIRHTVAYINGLADDFFKTEISVIKHRLVILLKSHYGGDVELDHDRLINDVLSLHRLGYLPLEYRAIDEGLKVPIGVPLFTVKNTHKDFSWLVNNFETLTSQLFWPMVNTATKIDQFYQQSKYYGELSTPKDVLDFWLPVSVHNFESRGMFGPEHAARAGAVSCIPFIGSDTINAITFAAQYYDYNVEKDAPICVSVRASEHADITRLLSEFRYRGINEDTELEVIKRLAQHTTGIFSYVADSENYFRTISEYALAAKEWILNRKDGGNGLPAKWVWRPDSSKKRPLEVICGDPESSCELERKGSLQILWEVFGGVEVDTPTGKMKLINPKVGLIYGEAISQKHQKEIYERMIELGFSVSNLIIGKGSYANLENNTRDLFSMTFKQTFSIAEIDGKRVNLDQQKTPMGDVSKKSAKGLLMVDENFMLHQEVSEETEQTGLLSLLYRNGNMLKQQSFIGIKDLYFKQC